MEAEKQKKLEDLVNSPEYAEVLRMIGEQMEARSKQEQGLKVINYKTLNRKVKKGSVLFTGSSLMELFPVCEMAASAGITKTIYNRGIGGTTTDDFLREIDTVLIDLQPAKVFINIGTNDMTDRVYGDGWMAHLFENYETIIKTAVEKIPGVEIYMMAYYPTNHHLPDKNEWTEAMLKERTLENIAECNRRVAALAEKYGQKYIDVNAGLTDENGEQKKEFAIDGVHMLTEAYDIIFDNLKKYI